MITMRDFILRGSCFCEEYNTTVRLLCCLKMYKLKQFSSAVMTLLKEKAIFK